MARKKGKILLPKVTNAILFDTSGLIAWQGKAMTDSSLEITTNKTDKRAGQNNEIIGSIFSERNLNVTLTAGDWNIEYLATQVGAEIEIGKQAFTIDNYSATAVSGTITLPEIPADKKAHVKIGDTFIKVDATTTTIDLTDNGVTDECIEVVYIVERLGRSASVDTGSNPFIGKLILTTPLFDGKLGEIGRYEVEVPVFQLDGNFTQSFTADATYSLTGTAIADDVCGSDSQVLGFVKQYTEDDEDIMNFSSIIIAPSVIEIEKSGSETVSVYGVKNELYAKISIPISEVTLVSTTPATATASETGVVTGVAEGTTTITATYKGITATANVTVTD